MHVCHTLAFRERGTLPSNVQMECCVSNLTPRPTKGRNEYLVHLRAGMACCRRAQKATDPGADAPTDPPTLRPLSGGACAGYRTAQLLPGGQPPGGGAWSHFCDSQEALPRPQEGGPRRVAPGGWPHCLPSPTLPPSPLAPAGLPPRPLPGGHLLPIQSSFRPLPQEGQV